jgi:hypothetical protein
MVTEVLKLNGYNRASQTYEMEHVFQAGSLKLEEVKPCGDLPGKAFIQPMDYQAHCGLPSSATTRPLHAGLSMWRQLDVG